MDFYAKLATISPQLERLIRILNDENIAPDLRRAALESALQRVSAAIYFKAYDMTAFDMDIRDTRAAGLDRAMAAGLARNISDAIATGAMVTALAQLGAFANHAALLGQSHASDMAGSLGNRRTLQIVLRGKGDCDWCRAKAARGKISNPSPEDFQRHTNCDCFFDVQGYKSRNGELKNYRPL